MHNVTLNNGVEQAVGRAIAASGIHRDQLVVTTKLWVQDSGEDNTADNSYGATSLNPAALRR